MTQRMESYRNRTGIWTVASFYRFFPFQQCGEYAEPVREKGNSLGIGGTVLLAPEGINSTVAGTGNSIPEFLDFLKTDCRLPLTGIKMANSNRRPFARLKVKVKKEIVTFRQPGIDPSRQENVGTAVPPEAWNELISQPDTLVIDTRNDYEVQVGKFSGAIDPGTENFTEFASWVKTSLDPEKHRKIAMYCTGGIRCEKATAFLKKEGFAHVYQLRGGILNYFREMSPEESLWEGDCFVFDERVAVDHLLGNTNWEMCPHCNRPFLDQCDCGKANLPKGELNHPPDQFGSSNPG